MKTKPVQEVWVTLEQASEILGESWLTVWRWARNGDPRLPAYRVWDERSRGDSSGDQSTYRFKRTDVEALQAQMTTEASAVHSS
jgi:hypothetical protein